jgi:hypothetical protein
MEVGTQAESCPCNGNGEHDFSEPFTIHMDASHCQTGGMISQDKEPMTFYSRKLASTRTHNTMTECEILYMVEPLKDYCNILLRHKIEVFTNHQNPVCKPINTECVMRWCLILEEFGPPLTHIKGENIVITATLSRLDTTGNKSTATAFVSDQEDFQRTFPLRCANRTGTTP